MTSADLPAPPDGTAPPAPPDDTAPPDDGTPWHRLSGRMIVVDLVRTLVSLAPLGLAVWVFGINPGSGALWPVIGVAVFGVLGSAGDVLRWVFTRYRVTGSYLEIRSGVLVRTHRSVRRDRIRSVDTDARLHHRLAGLRLVKVGAGHQLLSGESALRLDAITRADAAELRALLLRGSTAPPVAAPDRADAMPDTEAAPDRADDQGQVQVFARFRPGWVVYNMVAWWGYLMAIGLLWGAFWLASTFGLDLWALVRSALDWQSLGWFWTVAIAVAAVGLLGVIGLAVNFFTSHWGFELVRAPGEDGTVLRTTQGLLRTREVTRSDSRLRGVSISEPVLWRWMGMADTEVITTGLSIWSGSSTILPRGPISVARPVAARILAAEPNPFAVPLRAHPRRALRRRLCWAGVVSVVVAGVLVWLALTDVVPWSALWALAGVVPLAAAGAVVAYRALGHAISGRYVVLRSGLMSRTTTVLQRSAVSTVAVRESLLQRRLGLRSVSTMTAAGWGAYAAPDLDAHEAAELANEASAGLLEPFLVPAHGER